MARRTKEEALATRQKLLDAAECLFQMQGVSHTSLQDIAQYAGATRGAVYWHFKDKADLFNAMMERVTLPLEGYFNPEDSPPVEAPAAGALQQIRSAVINALNRIVHDARTRRVLEVATQKVEYVEEHNAIRLRHIAVRNGFYSRVEERMEAACRETTIRLAMPIPTAALGLHALLDGLIQNWLLEPESFNLVSTGRSAMDVYLRGLGFTGTQEERTET